MHNLAQDLDDKGVLVRIGNDYLDQVLYGVCCERTAVREGQIIDYMLTELQDQKSSLAFVFLV